MTRYGYSGDDVGRNYGNAIENGYLSMKIAVLGDSHLVSDDDSYKELHGIRAFLKDSWPSFAKLLDRVNVESPDVVVVLGDLVDWISNENADFALDMLSELRVPWEMVLGNHDIQNPERGVKLDAYKVESSRANERFWLARGIEFGNRMIEIDDIGLVMIDSALSDIHSGTEEWLKESLSRHERNIVLTHVPIALPIVYDYIISCDPRRNMKKYVMSGAPDLYEECLRGHVDIVYTAHLHFPGCVRQDATIFDMLGMSISMRDEYNDITSIATATIVESNGGDITGRTISVS